MSMTVNFLSVSMTSTNNGIVTCDGLATSQIQVCCSADTYIPLHIADTLNSN